MTIVCGRGNFSATSRPVTGSVATRTTPKPPEPSKPPSTNRPTRNEAPGDPGLITVSQKSRALPISDEWSVASAERIPSAQLTMILSLERTVPDSGIGVSL